MRKLLLLFAALLVVGGVIAGAGLAFNSGGKPGGAGPYYHLDRAGCK